MMHPFSLADADKRSLARVLGLQHLSPEIAATIADAISAYKTTETGSADTTVGNTLAALAELSKKGRGYEKAVARIADDRCAIDYTTHGHLQPLAKAVLAKENGAADELGRAASARAEELRKHGRVNPGTEPLRFFGGVLRLIFDKASAPHYDARPKKAGTIAVASRWKCSRLPTSTTPILMRIQSGSPNISEPTLPLIDRQPVG